MGKKKPEKKVLVRGWDLGFVTRLTLMVVSVLDAPKK